MPRRLELNCFLIMSNVQLNFNYWYKLWHKKVTCRADRHTHESTIGQVHHTTNTISSKRCFFNKRDGKLFISFNLSSQPRVLPVEHRHKQPRKLEWPQNLSFNRTNSVIFFQRDHSIDREDYRRLDAVATCNIDYLRFCVQICIQQVYSS